jgi:ubiquinone/menaquinone biosynthesis C-methylase UbiE
MRAPPCLRTPAPFVEYALARHGPPGGLVLDVGCGPALYRHNSAGRYVGVDIADARRTGAPDGADIIAASDRLPLRDASFDLAFVKSALYLMDHPDICLREMRRVLKPGGRLIVFDYNRRTQRRLAAALSATYPSWTQRQLERRVAAAGFRQCRLLGAVSREVGWLEGLLRFPAQEWFGTWAIVTGVKPQ